MKRNTTGAALILLMISFCGGTSCATGVTKADTIAGRRMTAEEFVTLIESGAPRYFIRDTIVGEVHALLIGVGKCTLENVVFEGTVFFDQVQFTDVLRLKYCRFRKGCTFGLCEFKFGNSWGNFITGCTFDGNFHLDKCRIETSIYMDSCSFGNGIWIDNCAGGFGLELKDSHIFEGFLVQQTPATSTLVRCIWEPGSYIKGDFGTVVIWGCEFRGTVFEVNSLPQGESMGRCSGIENLTFEKSPSALTILRDWFKRNGYRQKEREATYALRSSELSKESRFPDFLKYLAFDWTCKWGMDPWLSVYRLFGIIFICTVLYFLITLRSRWGDIKLIAVEKFKGRNRETSTSISRVSFRPVRRYLCHIRLALIFSLMSSFNFGFKGLKFGRWIRLIFMLHDHDLRPTGWARPIAGLQALTSLVLVALFFLTLFGRPFD